MRAAALTDLLPRDHPIAVHGPDPAPLVGQARVQGDVRGEPRVRPYEVRAVDAGRHEPLHERDELDLDPEVDLCVFDLEVGDANVLVSLHAIAETATPRRRRLLDGVHATPSTRRLGLHAIGRARDADAIAAPSTPREGKARQGTRAGTQRLSQTWSATPSPHAAQSE